MPKIEQAAKQDGLRRNRNSRHHRRANHHRDRQRAIRSKDREDAAHWTHWLFVQAGDGLAAETTRLLARRLRAAIAGESHQHSTRHGQALGVFLEREDRPESLRQQPRRISGVLNLRDQPDDDPCGLPASCQSARVHQCGGHPRRRVERRESPPRGIGGCRCDEPIGCTPFHTESDESSAERTRAFVRPRPRPPADRGHGHSMLIQLAHQLLGAHPAAAAGRIHHLHPVPEASPQDNEMRQAFREPDDRDCGQSGRLGE